MYVHECTDCVHSVCVHSACVHGIHFSSLTSQDDAPPPPPPTHGPVTGDTRKQPVLSHTEQSTTDVKV